MQVTLPTGTDKKGGGGTLAAVKKLNKLNISL